MIRCAYMDTSIFEPVIGLEIHAQISTKTKMFCACDNDSFGKMANSNVCPVCMGFPGMLPVINSETVEKGAIAALALNCTVQEYSKFDRKNYFYPDSPKGFQISQYDKPISTAGHVEILVEREKKKIRVNRLHLEDDAGKLIHVGNGTLCDYNRSGSPLMEIVSEPDLRSIGEASAYAQEIRRILRYVDASDCDMEKGMMRFDINVSLRKKGQEKFGVKVEVKNLNSFRALEHALAYEIERQSQALTEGRTIIQETRGWDDVKGITVSQRSKEEAHDYRYFPEPDLPPVLMDKKHIDALKKAVVELPLSRRIRFVQKYGINEEDALLLTEDRVMADYFEDAVKECSDAKKTVSFINTILLKHLNKDGIGLIDCKVKAVQIGKLVSLINSGVVSNNTAKQDVFEAMYASGEDPEKIIKAKGLNVVSDTGSIEEACRKVLAENSEPVSDYKGGKTNAFGFLVGKVMQSMEGKANPIVVNETLKKLL